MLLGSGVILALGWLLARVLPLGRAEEALARVGKLVTRPPPTLWAASLGLLTLLLATLAARGLHHGLPGLVDSMAQLLHARAFAAGSWTLPLPEPAAARLLQNSVALPGEWASIYPPGHTLALAGGLAAGVPWLVGPLLTAVAVGVTALALEHLAPGRPAVARTAGIAVALSPFLLLLGSTYLSHSTALATGAVALWASLRSVDARGPAAVAWALLAGFAVGAMVASRPWTGLTLGGFLVVGPWLLLRGSSPTGEAQRPTDPTPGMWLARTAAVGLGGLPWAAFFFGYHARVFGSPTTLGYAVAFGPAHGLGFHRDPWGNLYGVREALAYTGTDLSTLSLRLFETPLPAVAVVGLFLLAVPRVAPGTRLLLGWALVPVAANALYWHHGQFLGPRMLLEAAPAWAALLVWATFGLVEGRDPAAAGPGSPEEAPGGPPPDWRTSRRSAWAAWSVALAVLAGGALLLPTRLAQAETGAEAVLRSHPPQPPGDAAEPRAPVVVVHGSWANRIASRLAGAGMRRDSVETALRRNGLCRVHLYAEARRSGAEGAGPTLDLRPLPGRPPGLLPVESAPGTRIYLQESRIPPACVREIRADRFGTVELAPLLWQTSLPGGVGPVLVRDLGPEENARTLEAYPGRPVVYWGPLEEGVPPDLAPYATAMEQVWGVSAPEARR
jgi:hypothetical protein